MEPEIKYTLEPVAESPSPSVDDEVDDEDRVVIRDRSSLCLHVAWACVVIAIIASFIGSRLQD
jgi:hypothetical protein